MGLFRRREAGFSGLVATAVLAGILLLVVGSILLYFLIGKGNDVFVSVLADPGYEGAGHGIFTPVKNPPTDTLYISTTARTTSCCGQCATEMTNIGWQLYDSRSGRPPDVVPGCGIDRLNSQENEPDRLEPRARLP
jgi:hypothetical protein